MPLLAHLFTAPELQPAAPNKKGFVSVGAKFAADLHSLVATLQQTEAHYIRCLKPNLEMKPRLFVPEVVRTRLRAAGTRSHVADEARGRPAVGLILPL